LFAKAADISFAGLSSKRAGRNDPQSTRAKHVPLENATKAGEKQNHFPVTL
jgi:hypothetical protein